MLDPNAWEQSQILEPIVRDVMAIERTVMANERTLLAFWRTNVHHVHCQSHLSSVFGGTVMQIIGWVFIPTGVVVFAQGVRIYRRMNQVIQRAGQAVEQETQQEA